LEILHHHLLKLNGKAMSYPFGKIAEDLRHCCAGFNYKRIVEAVVETNLNQDRVIGRIWYAPRWSYDLWKI
jgi:hypothetical protein